MKFLLRRDLAVFVSGFAVFHVLKFISLDGSIMLKYLCFMFRVSCFTFF